MASLSLRSATRIALRETHHARGKFFFVVLSVAVGVAALSGVRGFSDAFRSELLLRARSIMAGDLSARMFQQPTPDQQRSLDALRAQGIQLTQVTEMVSMAAAPGNPDPVLVSLKAIDPALYPFYGEVKLAPAMPLARALTDSSVAVADDLLMRLHRDVGDTINLGGKPFRIAATILDEPDRLSGAFISGPRILITRQALAATGLLAPGSRATERFLFKLPAPASDDQLAAAKSELEQALPESQVQDFRETNPALSEGLNRATSLLSLMSLVALVLGAVGVAMAMRAHLAQRLDTIAIMKSLGARSSQVMKIYLIQTLLLGIAGGLLGVALGVGVQLSFPFLLAKLVNVQPDLHLEPGAIAISLAAGLLTTLLFTLPPLLDIRGVRPILILRRAVEGSDDPFITSIGRNLRKNLSQLFAGLLIIAGIAVIAATLSGSTDVGKAFVIGLVAVLLVLLAASAAVLKLLRWLLSRTRLQLPSVLRHGLANLYRPGNPSSALLAALGLGVMQMMLIFLVQQAVVSDLNISASPRIPNVFLIDITSHEIDGVRSILNAQAGLTAPPELLPIVSSRILAIDGVDTASLTLQHMPRRALRSTNLTWADTPNEGTRVVSGAWWTGQQARDTAHPLVAVERNMAQRLNLHLGSQITFAAQDQQFTATVAALVHYDGQHTFSRVDFILPARVLAGLPAVWYGGIHLPPANVGKLQRALYAAYPTITIIDVAAAIETVRQVVLNIIYVVQFLAAFSIFAGIIILASAIAGTRYRRIREVVVLKTLGATRTRIASIFSIEFAVLGSIAALVGLAFANLAAQRILHLPAIGVDYHFHPWWNLAALVLTATLTVAAGWIASHRILGQKPLEILREE